MATDPQDATLPLFAQDGSAGGTDGSASTATATPSGLRSMILYGTTLVSTLLLASLVTILPAIDTGTPFALTDRQSITVPCAEQVLALGLSMEPLPTRFEPTASPANDDDRFRVGTCVDDADRSLTIWVEWRPSASNGSALPWKFLYGHVMSILVTSPTYRRALVISPDSASTPMIRMPMPPAAGRYTVRLLIHATGFVPYERWAHENATTGTLHDLNRQFIIHALPANSTSTTVDIGVGNNDPPLFDDSWQRASTSDPWAFHASTFAQLGRQPLAGALDTIPGGRLQSKWVMFVGDSTFREVVPLLLARLNCTLGDANQHPHPYIEGRTDFPGNLRMFDTELQPGLVTGPGCPFASGRRPARLTNFWAGSISVHGNWDGAATLNPPTNMTDRFARMMEAAAGRTPDIVFVTSSAHDYVLSDDPMKPTDRVMAYRARMGILLDFIRSQVGASTPVVVVTSNHIVDAVWFKSAVDMVMIDLHRISRELATHRGMAYLDRWVARLSHEAYFTQGQRGVHCTDKKPPEPYCWEQAAIFAALA